MKRSGRQRRVKVSADGRGVVSHAGAALLRELATETGLAGGVSAALLGLLDPFAALVIGGRRVGEQRGAVISQRPDTSRAVGQQAHSLQVRAGPREPVPDLSLWPVVVQHCLLGVAEALAFDDRFHDLADRR